MTMQIRHDTPGITWAAAAALARAAVEAAELRGLNVNVAVVDRAGNLMALLRMPDAYLHSMELAIDKAYTAAGFGFPTEQWPAVLDESRALWCGLSVRPRLVVLGGGLPILLDGGVRVGGIGVSGGSEADDVACAQTALRQLGLATS